MISIDSYLQSNQTILDVVKNIKNENKALKAFVNIIDQKELPQNTKGSLSGVPYGAKDNILTNNINTTGCSKMLQNFVPFCDADAIKKLNNAGAVLVGKTNMDEFALGSTGLTSNAPIGPSVNPIDPTKVTGGSSSGSAVAVKAGLVPFALGSDTSGSIRQPASFCGVVGVKPSYHLVSNSGLIAVGSSLDCVGVVSSNVKDSATVLGVLADMDYTNINKNIAGKKIGVPKECFDYTGLDLEVKTNVEQAIATLEKCGAQIVPINLTLFEHALSVYNIICSAEFSSNAGKIDGMKYGQKIDGDSWADIFLNSRTAGFGDEAKARIIKGTFYLCEGNDKEFLEHAQKVRTMIINEYTNVLKSVDCIITPTTPSVAFNIGENFGDEDIYTVGASLVGLPAITVPYGEVNGLPVGVQIIAKLNDELEMFSIASILEENK